MEMKTLTFGAFSTTKARAMSVGPYFEVLSFNFEVLSFKNGTVFVQGTEYVAGISDEDLQAAIREANGQRDLS